MFEKYKSVLFIEKYHLDIMILYTDKAVKDWEKDKKSAERRMIHEFCHTITDPYYCATTELYRSKNTIEDMRERLTDHIAQIVNKHFNLI